MGALLIDHWIGAADRIETIDDASISEARERVRSTGKSAGLAVDVIERLAGATSELARNQLAHATGGAIAVRAVSRGGVAGVEVIAADHGGGIADPTAALAGAPRILGSLGIGLSAAGRQSDELDLDVRERAGSCIWIRSFATAVTRSELGMLARPHPDETVIGDHAVALRGPDAVTIAVADGLGHGISAREAADRAIGVVVAHPERSLEALLAEAHTATIGTRGAVMAIARVTSGAIEHLSIGNIGIRLLALDGIARPLASTAGTLGSAFPRRLVVEHTALAPGELVAMFSDGIQSRIDLTAEPAIVRRHPIEVAQHLLGRFARGTDDALVVVVR